MTKGDCFVLGIFVGMALVLILICSSQHKEGESMTWRITRKDHTPDGVEVEVLVGFTDDQAEVGCIMDEDRHKIDWDAEYCVEVDRE